MPRLIEHLAGGLVTARDPALLAPGELTQCDDLTYVANSSSLVTAPGLSEFSDAFAIIGSDNQSVLGLKAVRFNDGTHVLVASAADATNSVWTAPVGNTGTFTARDTVANIGAGPLEIAQYNNQAFLLTGITGNRVMLQGLTTRRHGLAAVTESPGVRVNSAAGTWSVPDDVFPAYYEYWITEIVRYSDGTELESTVEPPAASAAAPTPRPPTTTARVGAQTDTVSITRHPVLFNSDATHWRVYRSTRKDTAEKTAWPIGFAIATIPITDETVTATDVVTCNVTSGSAAATTLANFDSVQLGSLVTVVAGAGASLPADTYVSAIASRTALTLSKNADGSSSPANSTTLRFAPSTLLDAITFDDKAGGLATQVFPASPVVSASAGWTSTGNIFADDGANATCSAPSVNVSEDLVVGNFNFGQLAGPISGLQINLEYSIGQQIGYPTQPNGWLSVQISTDGGATFGARKTFPSVTSFAVRSLGGASAAGDFWGVQLSPEGLSGSRFRVKLRLSGVQSLRYQPGTCSVDYVSVQVASNQAPGASSAAFPHVPISVGDTQGLAPGAAGVGRNGKPPLADAADVFEDSLCTNDKAQPGHLRYSVAGLPHYFPSVYFVDFRTESSGTVTCLRTLNNKLIVGLEHSLWRVNYLPREFDAQFSRGRAIDRVSAQLGIANAQCATMFHGPDGRPELAFANRYGVFSTDGYVIRELVDDINWGALLAGSTYRPQPRALVDNPERWQLVLVYSVLPADGATDNARIFELHLNYHPQHLKRDGKLKVSGPVRRYYQNSAPTRTYGARSVVAVPRFDDQRRGTSVYYGTDVFVNAAVVKKGGKVYIDDTAVFTTVSLPGSPTNLAPEVRTRRMYLAGFGNEWKANELFVAHTTSASPTLTVTPRTVVTGAGETAGTGRTISATFNGLSGVWLNAGGEGIRFGIASSGIVNIDYVVVDGEDFGTQESGR